MIFNIQFTNEKLVNSCTNKRRRLETIINFHLKND